jgi:ABC-type multidrug transport system permease subunit
MMPMPNEPATWALAVGWAAITITAFATALKVSGGFRWIRFVSPSAFLICAFWSLFGYRWNHLVWPLVVGLVVGIAGLFLNWYVGDLRHSRFSRRVDVQDNYRDHE